MQTLQFTQLAKLNFEPADKNIVRAEGFRLTSGLHKLLQRVVFYLANSPGSVYGLPSVGSSRIAQLKSVSLAESTHAEQIVAGLQADIERWLKTAPSSLPAAEQIGTLKLSIESIGDESITIGVSITSADGSAADSYYELSTVN